MGYTIKAGVGLALFFGAIVLFNVKLQELLDTGTCTSGNVPFEIRQGYECPEGTGTDVVLVMASVLIGLIGAAIFAFRGDPPWGRRKSVGLFGFGTLAWGIFFAGTGAALLLAGPYGEITDPNTGETVGRPDSQLGATITGITFLVMGVPALLLGGWSTVKRLVDSDERGAASPSSPAAAGGVIGRMRAGMEQAQAAQGLGRRLPWGGGAGTGGPGGGGDVIGKIERLQRLRESGAISDAEFEREKAKVLALQ